MEDTRFKKIVPYLLCLWIISQMIKCWQIPDCHQGAWGLGLQNMEDVIPEIEGNKVPWRELVEVLVSARTVWYTEMSCSNACRKCFLKGWGSGRWMRTECAERWDPSGELWRWEWEGGCGVARAQRKGGRKSLEGFYQWGSNDCIFMIER